MLGYSMGYVNEGYVGYVEVSNIPDVVSGTLDLVGTVAGRVYKVAEVEGGLLPTGTLAGVVRTPR